MNWTPATPIRPATPILPALFSYSYVLPIFYPLCFDIHACNGGCTPPPWGFDHLSPLLIPYPLSQHLCFQAIPHSLAKTPGVKILTPWAKWKGDFVNEDAFIETLYN